ncbi:MAG: nuclear transport factor 2 family protein [Alphaproteobacteria bacterium]|nr:nuclear transport factor 2 family protein [Alphaproteobacteria bacterium]
MSAAKASRRSLIGAAGLALTASGAAQAKGPDAAPSSAEATIRRFYGLWRQPDWAPFDAIMADSFTFSSPHGDDHIDKAAFKTRCWETQKDFTRALEIERLFAKGDDAFVQYLGHTANGKTFRNVEFVEVRAGKIASVTCYFGGADSFPSAVSAQS